MRDSVSSKALTYGFLALFVFMVAVPLYWMVTTALKTNKELYEEFSYIPRKLTLENFVRVIVREELLTNIRNSFSVAMSTTLFTVVVSAMAALRLVQEADGHDGAEGYRAATETFAEQFAAIFARNDIDVVALPPGEAASRIAAIMRRSSDRSLVAKQV